MEARIWLIAGPTASGKSALALRLAQATGGEIVCADSMQLYRDLRVLTARPSAEEEALAPHHLFGVADAADAWSVGRWLRAAGEVLADIEARGRTAIVVGGTGLYFRALTHGLVDVPPVPEAARLAAGVELEALGEVSFRDRLRALDPEAEARIAPGDRQRLVRAFGVATATGRSLTDWQAGAAADPSPPLRGPPPPRGEDWRRAGGDTGASSSPLGEGDHAKHGGGGAQPHRPLQEWRAVVLDPPRAELYAACDRRLASMLDHGALDEVRALLARDLSPDLPAMKAVGVRELAAHLRGETTLPEALAAAQRETRRYAKRQGTWFRGQAPDWPRLTALDPEAQWGEFCRLNPALTLL